MILAAGNHLVCQVIPPVLKLSTAIAKYSDSYQAVSIAKFVKDTIVLMPSNVVGKELRLIVNIT